MLQRMWRHFPCYVRFPCFMRNPFLMTFIDLLFQMFIGWKNKLLVRSHKRVGTAWSGWRSITRDGKKMQYFILKTNRNRVTANWRPKIEEMSCRKLNIFFPHLNFFFFKLRKKSAIFSPFPIDGVYLLFKIEIN